ncbi:MAG: hypothetical protein QF898_11950 [SAR202 cluster bacterium]|jgi:hypothetical protein|nr:hypothetical protein [SAR202 cluster bacterium]MDP6513055.1 hypothetical protein [SAR202 cluster bacterium]
MEIVTINIEPNSPYRASETMADLRNAAESMYFPMKTAGFWDSRLDFHLCPEEERRQECPHRLANGEFDIAAYSRSLERTRHATLQLEFPHAQITIYLR